jgi:hypothetical protein
MGFLFAFETSPKNASLMKSHYPVTIFKTGGMMKSYSLALPAICPGSSDL